MGEGSELKGEKLTLSPPGPVEQFDLCQTFTDHGGEEQREQNTADQDVVVVIFQHVELLGGVHPGLVDVKTVRNHQTRGLQARGGSVDSFHSRYGLIVVDEPLCADGHLWGVGYKVLLTAVFSDDLWSPWIQEHLGERQDGS